MTELHNGDSVTIRGTITTIHEHEGTAYVRLEPHGQSILTDLRCLQKIEAVHEEAAPQEPVADDLGDLTVKQLRELLLERGGTWTTSDTKATLLAKLRE